ncbi:Chromosome segregation atpase [Teratosphaeria destructans]|uniref:Chromosome segregation atpase n=1 Tax=Teratosphaeria destructans TaxID=418781 RepID=A0A9W7VYX5_9PEZI|nr:Chromosome segregation atpase [Teratosphaeria destructans]
MSGPEREVSHGDAYKHQHSWSENGRSSVPIRDNGKMQLLTRAKRRWDSSDPERAPPPLPFPPGANSPTTRGNTSAGIAAAAKRIVEASRESAPLSSYTSNVTPQGSPERSLVKGAHHKRMQSLQTTSVKDLRSYLDSNRSPERSPERPTSRGGLSNLSRQQSADDMSIIDHSSTPTPAAREPMKDTPTLRPSTRPPPRPLLGENTPPSATMLALQTMQVPDQPFNDITNGPSTPSPMRVNPQFDLSAQLKDLLTITTSLQKEMTGLNRRSKDNAIDLISLKEATTQRDEDIRTTLRELKNHVRTTGHLPAPPSSFGTNILDSKPFNSPPSASKAWSVPRAASAHSFLDDGRLGSPSPYSVEGAASVAMLEKIIREMVTKEGQDRLQSCLSELLEKSRKENTDAAKKVEELSEFIKEKSQSQALVAMSKDGPPKLELNFDSPGNLKVRRETDPKAPKDDEVAKLLTKIKESVAHTGGSTNEVKGLVRDLRGEVLGMGRDLGRKLDQVAETQLNSSLDKGIEDGQSQQHAEEVQRIVEEGMAQLKEHLSSILQQRAEQDDNAFKQLAVTRSGPNSEEMLSMVKHALAEHSSNIVKTEPPVEEVDRKLDHEAILDAVKEGLKDFEPNIELQQYGLERDEVLNVLKEGLLDYQANRPEPEPAVATIDKGEIFEVMQEALKDFQAPMPAEAMNQMTEAILNNVRQALAEHQPNVAAAAVDSEAIHAQVVAAVKEGLSAHGPAAPRELEISRDDLFEAVKAGMDGSAIPFGSFGEQVVQKMRELVENMHTEFQQYSAANGRDTEQVLDAVKDGLESLRAQIEQYVDRAQDVTGKDEIVDTVKGGLEQLRADVQGYVQAGPGHDGGKQELLEYIKAEFEHLHAAVATSEASRAIDGASKPQHTAEIVLAITEGMTALKEHINEKNREFEIEFPTEEINDALKEELEQLKAAVLNANAADKSELIETIQDSMGALHSKLNGSELSNVSGGASEEIIGEMRTEFAALKETMKAIVADADRDAIVSSIKGAIDDLRTRLSAEQSDASAEAVGALKEELEKLKETLGSSLVLGSASSSSEHSEVLAGIRGALDEIKDTTGARSASGDGVPAELLEAMRGEFENLRNSIATSMVHGGSNEEVLDAIRLGLDDLRSHLEKKLDSPDRNQAQQSEMLDAINEGLESLRNDVVKTLDKPLDMTVNYEILDTLKDGLAELRAGLDALKSGGLVQPDMPKGGEIVLADPSAEAARELSGTDVAPVPAAVEHLKAADLERVEVLLAQVQIKVEAMDAKVEELPTRDQAPAQRGGDALTREDLAALETMIKDVQDNIITLAAREPAVVPDAAPEGVAKKEDTDAIETLLRNTKAQIDEMVLPDPTTTVTKEQLDAVEAVIRVTQEGIDGLADRLENSTAAKADVAVVEVLAQDVKTVLEEIKDKMSAAAEEEKPDLMTKADFDVLGVLCTEIKTKMEEMKLPNPEELPSKADVEQLQGLIADFRESHDKLKDSYETDIAVTAKAFDDRKQEFEDTVKEIAGIKEALGGVKDELISKIGDSETGINTLGETLKGLEEKAGNAHEPVIAEVKEVLEALNREFERAHGSLEAMKVDHQQSSETALEKQAEYKDGLISTLTEKLDALFDGLMSKYDDAQHAAEEKVKTIEAKSASQAELMDSTKSMAEELRLSIDTLGSTLTTFAETFPEKMDALSEESKTVFGKVEETAVKLDETTQGLKGEHATTRDEVAKVLAAIDGVQNDLGENHPRFIVTLEEVKALIGQHYEHSQKAADTAAEHHQAVRELQEQLKQGFEDTKARHDTSNEDLKSAIPALLPPPAEIPAQVEVEKYDDTALHEKLDKLMGHAEAATEPTAQIERLDQIHEKVMATAAEVSAFVAAQAKQITEDHENKEKEAEEVALLLERRMVQKDEIEDDITVLNEEKDSLRQAVEALRAEKEALAGQKSRLQADVSSLETALHIRREELHEMDSKAEAIERRMLEGVMNQSRMLLLAKSTKPAAQKQKKPQGRDLRVPSNASAMSHQTATSTVPSLAKANHALAMKTRPGIFRNGPVPNSAERRIMSLNEISHNQGRGAQAFSTATPSLISNSSKSLKRSQSVKQPQRNLSWGGKRNLTQTGGGNKENDISSVSEESEDELARDEELHSNAEDEDANSEATERRHSYLSGTGTSLTYGDRSYADGETPGTDDGRRTSYGASDLSYGTGSYMTGSDVSAGRDSLASSSAAGVVGVESAVGEDPREDDSEGEEEPDAAEPLQLEAPRTPADDGISEHDHAVKTQFAPPSDSGLGTDLPTAALSATEGDYFRSEAE